MIISIHLHFIASCRILAPIPKRIYVVWKRAHVFAIHPFKWIVSSGPSGSDFHLQKNPQSPTEKRKIKQVLNILLHLVQTINTRRKRTRSPSFYGSVTQVLKFGVLTTMIFNTRDLYNNSIHSNRHKYYRFYLSFGLIHSLYHFTFKCLKHRAQTII